MLKYFSSLNYIENSLILQFRLLWHLTLPQKIKWYYYLKLSIIHINLSYIGYCYFTKIEWNGGRSPYNFVYDFFFAVKIYFSSSRLKNVNSTSYLFKPILLYTIQNISGEIDLLNSGNFMTSKRNDILFLVNSQVFFFFFFFWNFKE